MKRFLFLITINFVCLLFITAYSQNLQTPFVNKEYDYSICFPEKWNIKTLNEHNNVVRCETPDTTEFKRGSISIMIMPVDAGSSIKSVRESLEKPMKQFLTKNFEELKSENVKINGKDFYMYAFSYFHKADMFNKKTDFSDKKQRNVNFYFSNDKMVYCVMFWGEDEFFEANKELILKSIYTFKLN